MEEIQIQTTDGFHLSGLLWDRGGSKSALLLHAMPATKEAWEELAEELYTKGINVLAIDFRGHGTSEGIPYKDQKPDEVQKYFLDARAALNFLEEKYNHTNFVLAGASIGANIALQCMSHDHAIKKSAVLSAGLDYYGVKAKDFVKELSPEQKVLFVGANDDQGRGEMAEELFSLASSKKEKLIYEAGGHGTNMWKENEELLDKLVNFLVS